MRVKPNTIVIPDNCVSPVFGCMLTELFSGNIGVVLYFLSMLSILSDWISDWLDAWVWEVFAGLRSSFVDTENETELLLDALFDLNGIKEKRFFLCWLTTLLGFFELLDEWPEKIYLF